MRLDEFKDVFRNLELIEGKAYKESQKNEIINGFFVENYIRPDVMSRTKPKVYDPLGEKVNRLVALNKKMKERQREN